MTAVVFTSVFFEYFVVWYFKYLIIGNKGYLQKTKLFFLGILSHAEIPVNGKMAISTDKLHQFQHHFLHKISPAPWDNSFLRNWIFASLLFLKESRGNTYFQMLFFSIKYCIFTRILQQAQAYIQSVYEKIKANF